MLFVYTSVDEKGQQKQGEIEAPTEDTAINSLQRRGLVVISIDEAGEEGGLLKKRLKFFDRIPSKDIVILSRQISTLFEAQVSALKIFNLLASETENHLLRKKLGEIATDLQGGSSVSKALDKHQDVFSTFYISMVRAGEESGRLDETFMFLADHLDRTYELTSKAKNALIYPIFVVFTFVAVMVLMLTTVIPKISAIILDSGQEVPVYTKVVIAISNVFLDYGVLLLILLAIGGFFFWKFLKTGRGKLYVARLKISIPYIGSLYKKLYLSRLADNMHTMLLSGIPMVRALEVTSEVVDNKVYADLLNDAVDSIKGGQPVSDSLAVYKEIPPIMIQMIRVGEETGELGSILETLSKFYRREVNNAVDTLVSLIEPVMIVLLGLGVGLLLASVLIPIYNISSSI